MTIENESEELYCSNCDGSLYHLGYLGNKNHFKCRDCGSEFSFDVPKGFDPDAEYVEESE